MGVDAFEVYAVIKAKTEEFDKSLEKSKGKLTGLKSALGTAGKVAGAAVAGAGVAIGGVVKQSVSAYAEYQQLTGGVQKLYGNMGKSLEEYAASVGKTTDEVKDEWENLEKAQNEVLKNARNAYMTSGMSMNEYMETATSFSAALINSLEGDTLKAAESTEVAMKAISDNFNTFGGDVESVKNAFKGFAKQNYTMLDNLKLGYGGTKSEMERLIADANEYGKSIGMANELSIDSFADVVTAIELVQEKQGIAGTTLAEAEKTISGSAGSARAAWENLKIGLADDSADIDQLLNNFIESATKTIENVAPKVEKALKGVGLLVKKVAPIIGRELPKLAKELLPGLLEAATELVRGLIEALPGIVATFVTEIPGILQTLVDAIEDTINAMFDAIDEKFPGLGMTLQILTNAVLAGVAAWTIYKGVIAIQGLISTITTAISALKAATEGQTIAQWAMNAAMNANPVALVITAIVTLIGVIALLWAKCEWFRDLVTGMINNIKESFSWLGEQISNIWNNLIEFIKGIFDSIGGFFDGLWNAIADAIGWIVDKIKGLIEWIEKAISKLGELMDAAVEAVLGSTGLAEANAAITAEMDAIKNDEEYKRKMRENAEKYGELGAGSSSGGGGSSAGMPTNIPTNRSVNNSSRSAAESALDEVSGGITSSSTAYTSSSGGLGTYGTSQGPNNSKVVIPVYIGQERIEEIVVDANNRNNYRTGGR